MDNDRASGPTPCDARKIAFLIIAHADPEAVRRLVGRLKPHDVFIHLDLKTPMNDTWRSIEATFVEPRLPVYWAGYSQVEATLRLITAALSSGERYSKIMLLSGSCYPIRPVEELARLFETDDNANYVRYVDMTESDHLMTMISRRYRRDGILPWQLTSRYRVLNTAEKVVRKAYALTVGRLASRWAETLTPYHGSQWWALSPAAAAYVLEQMEQRQGLARKYRQSFAPDEQFVPTIIGNSAFATKSTGKLPFTGRGTWKTANFHIVDPSLARWFTINDLDEVVGSDKYFVRKINTARSTALLDALDEHARRLGSLRS